MMNCVRNVCEIQKGGPASEGRFLTDQFPPIIPQCADWGSNL
jgi:hypothetical protein